MMEASNLHAQQLQETPFLYWHPISRGDSRQQGQFTQSPRRAASVVPSQASQQPSYSVMRAVTHPVPMHSNWAADVLPSEGTGLSTPTASPRPMVQKPTILINDELTRQPFFRAGDGAWETYTYPSTPTLSASGSTISSPPSSCFSASGNDSTLFGDECFEDFKHACDVELKSVSLNVEGWGGNKSPSSTPKFANAPITTPSTTQPSDLLSINACPSLSPSPSPHFSSVSQSEFDCCDPRLITVGSAGCGLSGETTSFNFPTLPTLCAGDDEEHKLILGDELLTQPNNIFPSKIDLTNSLSHTFPAFENISDFESDEDFVNSLAKLADPSQVDGHHLSATRQRPEYGQLDDDDLVSDAGSDSSDCADHQFINGLPSPPESTSSSRRGSEDSMAGIKTKRKTPSRKARRSGADATEISDADFLGASPSMRSTASDQSSGHNTTRRQQSTSAQAQSTSASQSQSTSPAASAPSAPPSSANRRGRKQSLTEDPSKTFVCDLCSRRFRRQEHLKRHYRSLHTLEKPFECNECGKKFSRSDNLAQHARTHGSGAIVMSFLGDETASEEQAESVDHDMAHELGYALYEAVHAAAGSTTATSSVDGSLRDSESPSPAEEDQPRKRRRMT